MKALNGEVSSAIYTDEPFRVRFDVIKNVLEQFVGKALYTCLPRHNVLDSGDRLNAKKSRRSKVEAAVRSARISLIKFDDFETDAVMQEEMAQQSRLWRINEDVRRHHASTRRSTARQHLGRQE